MAEQTHSKGKQNRAQEDYFTNLQKTDAYNLLRIVFLRGAFSQDRHLNSVVAMFLDNGIVTDRQYLRSISNSLGVF